MCRRLVNTRASASQVVHGFVAGSLTHTHPLFVGFEMPKLSAKSRAYLRASDFTVFVFSEFPKWLRV